MTTKKLMQLVDERKCVVWLSGKHMPATVLAHMPFRTVLSVLPRIREHKRKGAPARASVQ